MRGARSHGWQDTVWAIHQVLHAIETVDVPCSCVMFEICKAPTSDQSLLDLARE